MEYGTYNRYGFHHGRGVYYGHGVHHAYGLWGQPWVFGHLVHHGDGIPHGQGVHRRNKLHNGLIGINSAGKKHKKIVKEEEEKKCEMFTGSIAAGKNVT